MRGQLMTRWARPVAMAGALCLVVTVVAVAIGAQDSEAATASYVALGDSYTAGPFLPVLQAPIGCLRSDHNYPHLIAAALATPIFRDASCAGATTNEMTNPQNVDGGPNPPQLDSLDPLTELVTIGIGGNDIGFVDIVKSCVTFNPNGTPCQDHYVHGAVDDISDRITATAPKVAQVLQDIHTRSPLAKVVVVGYLDILPETGSGCFPQMPIAFADVPYLRAKEHQLNDMLAQQAAANNATFVDTYTPSIGHDACEAPCRRWVEPLFPAGPVAPIHPNAVGMQATAAIVLDQPPPVSPAVCPVAAPVRFTG